MQHVLVKRLLRRLCVTVMPSDEHDSVLTTGDSGALSGIAIQTAICGTTLCEDETE